jgi:hypothetical protein
MTDTPSSPQRRRFFKLGLAGAAVLAVGGGVALMAKPLFNGKQLAPHAQTIMVAVARGVLGPSLPKDPAARQKALDGLLKRLDDLVNSLPPHAQAELGQLLGLLGTAAGRFGLAGLGKAWDSASDAEVEAALQGMRTSGVAMKRQAYSALHDMAAGAYFSDPSTWGLMGYPGPNPI